MTNVQTALWPRQPSRLLVAGAILAATGGVIGLTGLTLAAVATVMATRQRMEQMDVPPGELAKRQLKKAKAAVSAGAGAWRSESAAAPLSSSSGPSTPNASARQGVGI
jgi:hypothetical protein